MTRDGKFERMSGEELLDAMVRMERKLDPGWDLPLSVTRRPTTGSRKIQVGFSGAEPDRARLPGAARFISSGLSSRLKSYDNS